MIVKAGNTGGSFAHKDIAFAFTSWISAEFKLFHIKKIQRLKESASSSYQMEWNLQHIVAKINHKIHTDAIIDVLLLPTLTKKQMTMCTHLRPLLLLWLFLVKLQNSGRRTEKEI